MRGEPGIGSMWTWTAIDADTKLIISWQLGARDVANAHAFMRDLVTLGAPMVTVLRNKANVDTYVHSWLP